MNALKDIAGPERTARRVQGAERGPGVAVGPRRPAAPGPGPRGFELVAGRPSGAARGRGL